jgi:hypothetical protein
MNSVRWRVRKLALLSVLSCASSALLLTSIGASRSQPAAAATVDSSFTQTKAVTRDHLINGKDAIVDSRNVTIKVDRTKGLRDRQGVNISWSGAHQTGGVVFDNTSQFAANQEYPVAILQCRGVDSATAPPSAQLSPETCFTPTPELRYQPPFRGYFPAYRLDRYATPADRTVAPGIPSPYPNACPIGAGAEHWLPFVAADRTSYLGGLNGCAGLAPEQLVVANPLSPASTTFGTTAADGTGSANFIVQNAEGNASLGCSATVACSLVVIPIMGISCDATAAALPAADRPTDPVAGEEECASTGFYQPGDAAGSQTSSDPNSRVAVNGQTWWSASNWRNRITVPIEMAQTAAVCDITGGGVPENIYGSQYLVQVTQQWAPKFCLDPSLFRLQQVQTSEVQAKNLLTSSVTNGQYLGVKAVFQAGPPAQKFANPIVQAPTAITGFGVVYYIDDAKHHPYTQLKLNARLLAKLLTMSYPAIPAVRDDWAITDRYKAAAKNPLDLSVDPEFLALNPGAKTSTINQLEASSTLFSMSSDSDVMTALTSYINVDPEARAWLNGQADPWGMVVNPNYKKIALPLANWPQLDTYYAPLNNCIADAHAPILPLLAAPVSDPSQITFNMQYGITNSQVNCVVFGQTDSAGNRKLQALGRQDVGIRFLLGIVGLGDAARYQLNSAALQTQKAADAPVKFTNDAGRTFATPTADSLLAAAKMLHPDTTLNTWTVPYDTLRTDPAGARAYPGTLLISTDVPTKGLTAADAKNFANLLTYAAGPGQVQGPDNGQLPDGYLPITAAAGLGNLVDYTTAAAKAVAAQDAQVPSVLGGSTASPSGFPPPTGGSTATAGSSSVSGGNTAPGGSSPAAGAASGSAANSSRPSANSAASPSGSSSSVAARPAGATSVMAGGWLSFAVPALAVLGLASALASTWISGVGRR